jgi:hypothetical protein
MTRRALPAMSPMHIVYPHPLSETASYDVASVVHRALQVGGKHATRTALLLIAASVFLGCCSAVLSSALTIGAPGLFTKSLAVTSIMVGRRKSKR